MAEQGWRNLVVMFFAQAERFGERPFLWHKRSGRYQPMTWREVAAGVCALSRGLKVLGVRPGDRVVLVAENRPEWLIADLAIMTAGAVTVPAYTTNSEDEHRYVFDNSGAIGAIVAGARLEERVRRAVHGLADIRFLIDIDPPPVQGTAVPTRLSWADAIALGESDHTNMLARAGTIAPQDLACIIYTSGTGGAPKGVMLPHRAILHNCRGGAEVLREIGAGDGGDPVFLSFLPLSHAYEHTCGQFLPIATGAEIYYAEGAEKLAVNLREARPTILTAVPRFFELLQGRIRADVRKTGGWRQWLFLLTLRLGRKRLHGTQPLTIGERIIDAVCTALVRRRLHQRFGGRLHALISGGAPLDPEVGAFFTALGLPIYQGYGQTESAPLLSVNRPRRLKMNTVGEPLPEVELKIADDGEIVVRGPMLMLGYWHNAQATADVLRDGWLHTGDIGAIDDDGHLHITDRKKDLIINSGGDNISPARVEALLTQRPEIAQAMVYGDRRPHLVALLVPDATWLKAWAQERAKPDDPVVLTDDVDLLAAMRRVVDETNATLSQHEKVRRFVLAPEAFSIENGQLTPTLKIRRHVIKTAYGAALDALYE